MSKFETISGHLSRAAGDEVVAQMAMRAAFGACCVAYFASGFQIPPLLGMGATGALSIGFIISSPRAMRLIRPCWPLLAMCGMAFLSAAWSVDPSVTIRRSFQLLFASLLGIAMVGRLGSVGAIKVLLRSMAFGCVISIVWVIIFPEVAVHQATDAAQAVHAGLWRGILSHKVDFGMFSGATFALLLFFGPRASGTPLVYLVGLVSALVCLIFAGSATGLVVGLTLYFTMRVTYANANQPLNTRKKIMRAIVLAIVLWIGLTVTGLLDQLAGMLGRSSDLTGRSTYWPFILDFLHSGNFVIGYGYVAGFKFISPVIAEAAGMMLSEAHNGYIDMIVAFGYLGGGIVIGLHVLLFSKFVNIQINSSASMAKVAAFPLGVMTMMLSVAYVESILLVPSGIFAILMPVAVAVGAEISLAERAERRRRVFVELLRRRAAQPALPLSDVTITRRHARLRAGGVLDSGY